MTLSEPQEDAQPLIPAMLACPWLIPSASAQRAQPELYLLPAGEVSPHHIPITEHFSCLEKMFSKFRHFDTWV